MPARPADLGRRLLGWFLPRRRDLPWRRSADPYRVWLSEVMLQQTRVEVVAPRYREFLRRFPAVRALAAAGEDEVLAAWSGLGYYSRARNLHRAARELVARHGGRFPRDPEAARSLPGVGPYTAAAVLSMAYAVPLPAVDGNVIRVLSRLHARRGDPRRGAAARRIHADAEALLDRRRPGLSNEAIMELGQTVCLPRSPRCGECPLRNGCAARRRGLVARLPERAPPRGREAVERGALLVLRRGRVLLARRRGRGPLRGLFELPGDRTRRDLAIRPGRLVATVRHSIMNQAIRLRVREGTLERGARNGKTPGSGGELRWVALDRLGSIPCSSLVPKALRACGALPGPVQPVTGMGRRSVSTAT